MSRMRTGPIEVRPAKTVPGTSDPALVPRYITVDITTAATVDQWGFGETAVSTDRMSLVGSRQIQIDDAGVYWMYYSVSIVPGGNAGDENADAIIISPTGALRESQANAGGYSVRNPNTNQNFILTNGFIYDHRPPSDGGGGNLFELSVSSTDDGHGLQVTSKIVHGSWTAVRLFA